MVSKAAYAPDSPSRAGTLDLIAGALALDFANTASGRGGPQHLEHLREPGHVLAWAEHAGVIDARTAKRAARALAAGAPGFATLLDDALALREAIHRIAAALAEKRTPAEADLALLK